MSDLHDRPTTVPSGDVLVIAGDFTCGDDELSLRSDLTWIQSLGFKHVLSVLGNHDLILKHLLKTKPEQAHNMLKDSGVTLLQDAEAMIEGIRFWGCDWQGRTEIPQGIDVVISHCPAFLHVDQRRPAVFQNGRQIVIASAHLGDEWLAKQVQRVGPKFVVSGHIHGGYGVNRTLQGPLNGPFRERTFINCSLVNEARENVNAPVVVELEGR
jgi:predicted MPP superfamily phosphohydrolase